MRPRGELFSLSRTSCLLRLLTLILGPDVHLIDLRSQRNVGYRSTTIVLLINTVCLLYTRPFICKFLQNFFSGISLPTSVNKEKLDLTMTEIVYLYLYDFMRFRDNR